MVLDSIRSQGKLDAALEARILAADSKARLEDIYLPYKPKRRTKAMIARENGLEPLADALLADPTLDPTATAAGYVDRERARRRRGARGRPRDPRRALLRRRRPHRRPARAHVEPRAARLHRPRGQGDRRAPSSPTTSSSPSRSPSCPRTGSSRCSAGRRRRSSTSPSTRATVRTPTSRSPTTSAPSPPRSASATRDAPRTSGWPRSVRWTWRTRILLGLQADLRVRLRTVAEEAAIAVFAANLRDLLLAAPAGTRATMGLDPGLRTGVKVAVVDATGKVVATDTIYPHEPRRDWNGALATLTRLAGRARRRPDRDRQRHGLARDGQAGRRAGRGQPRAEDDEGDGQRGRGVGVLGVGLRVGRAARPRRLAARRRVDRAPPAGPARRARQDRPEVDRRGPVPARPARVVAVALAGRRGRGRA